MRINQQELKSLFEYNADTGVFIRKVHGKGYSIHQSVGCLENGYIRIRIKGTRYHASRLAWLYVYGEEPTGMIDHINGIRNDNRICNLRVVTPRENGQNKEIHRTGRLPGVHLHKATQKWKAQISLDGHVYHLGLFLTEEEAHVAYQDACSNPDNVLSVERKPQKGYSFKAQLGKWVVRIQEGGRRRYVGYCDTEEEAKAMYERAKGDCV
jgi:hypothetical protein